MWSCERTNQGQDGVRKPRFPPMKEVDNLEDYRNHVIQVIVIGPFKDSKGLLGKYEKGCRRSGWIAICKGVRIRVTGVCAFEGGQATSTRAPNQ